jgi:hypothetical protein
MNNFQNSNPLVFLLAVIVGGVVIFGKSLTSAFSGRSSRQNRALAKARAAKRRKGRSRRRR